jgi:MerR family transcriptional regulator, light-induced transcriptional regulator
MSDEISSQLLRIGELSRRTGVRADTLRAWERRYGLLHPARSEGGFRLYGLEDEDRVRAMLALLDSGVSAAQAARLARAGATAPSPTSGPAELASISSRLLAALERFDEVGAHRSFDEAIAGFSTEALVSTVVLPVMAEIGDRWQSGEVGIAEEHFATNIVRGRLLGLARNWSGGDGPVALLACPPGELHDLGLICFGLLLRQRGWRIAYLGPDSPIDTVTEAARSLHAEAVALAAIEPRRFEAVAAPIQRLGEIVPVYLGGAGAQPALVDSVGAQRLASDLVSAAAMV